MKKLTPVQKEKLRQNLVDRHNKLIATTKQNFPEHEQHDIQEGEWHYFDAMFVSVDMVCSCGEVLKVTRRMVE